MVGKTLFETRPARLVTFHCQAPLLLCVVSPDFRSSSFPKFTTLKKVNERTEADDTMIVALVVRQCSLGGEHPFVGT